MLELDEQAAPSYLAQRLGIDAASIKAVSLGGGVSNHVVLAETPGLRLVLKQSLPKLRVEEDWYSDRDRIFRESGSLSQLAPILPAGWLPEVLFEDLDNYAYAMTAAPAGSVTWKEQLMSGVAVPATAEQVALIQSAIIQATWHSEPWVKKFGDLTVFRQLRLDPYYEVTAKRHPNFATHFKSAIDRCGAGGVCLVHGDWSPKNMMVASGSVMAIDFEVIHYGDPSFDSAFLLNHLVLKAFHRPAATARYHKCAEAYWGKLLRSVPQAEAILRAGTFEQLPLLLLARIDGKSPAEYISDPALKQRIRLLAFDLITRPASSPAEVFNRLEEPLGLNVV
ncbi:MAG: aminoglycoside phosphotransferase family protein [Bryobacteraceae bacterium]